MVPETNGTRATARLYDVVIVGSGFGGSINACRSAEAGRSVLVLERGRRYGPADFPRDVTDVDRLLWRYPNAPGSRGLYQLNVFSGLAVVVAAGVGGGSLIYANIHIRPDPVVFEDPRWPIGYDRPALDPFYDKVAATIGLAPVPADDSLPKRTAFLAAATGLGRSAFDPDEAVDWTKCKRITECEFGCPVGAKKSLDLNYLRRAEEAGAEIQPGAWVCHVEPLHGTYVVHFVDLNSGERRTVEGRRVVLSAGTLGTNAILLRSRDVAKTLPRLSGRLGRGISANGDFLGTIQHAAQDLDPWKGPDVTSVMTFFDREPAFTLAAPSFSEPVMAVLASFGQSDLSWLKPVSRLLWPRFGAVAEWSLKNGLLSQPLRLKGPGAGNPRRMTNLFAIGRDNAGGLAVLRDDRLDVVWNYAKENLGLIQRMEAAMRDVAVQYGGTFAPIGTWTAFRRITTVHPLGGCNLSESPDGGVVSLTGEVHNYPGLFVADGSVIPASIGFHPSMTIAAVAERIAEAVV